MTDEAMTYDDLQDAYNDAVKELMGVQEMLAIVLYFGGVPIEVDKFELKKGIPEGYQIMIDDQKDQFVFSMVKDV